MVKVRSGLSWWMGGCVSFMVMVSCLKLGMC